MVMSFGAVAEIGELNISSETGLHCATSKDEQICAWILNKRECKTCNNIFGKQNDIVVFTAILQIRKKMWNGEYNKTPHSTSSSIVLANCQTGIYKTVLLNIKKQGEDIKGYNTITEAFAAAENEEYQQAEKNSLIGIVIQEACEIANIAKPSINSLQKPKTDI